MGCPPTVAPVQYGVTRANGDGNAEHSRAESKKRQQVSPSRRSDPEKASSEPAFGIKERDSQKRGEVEGGALSTFCVLSAYQRHLEALLNRTAALPRGYLIQYMWLEQWHRDQRLRPHLGNC